VGRVHPNFLARALLCEGCGQQRRIESLVDTPDTDVPPELIAACTSTAELCWGLKRGSCEVVGRKAAGPGIYEVDVVGGGRSGLCIVTDEGEVTLLSEL